MRQDNVDKFFYKLLVFAKTLESQYWYRSAIILNAAVEKVSLALGHETNAATARAGKAFCYIGLKKYVIAKELFDHVIADAMRLDNKEALSIAYLNSMCIDVLARDQK